MRIFKTTVLAIYILAALWIGIAEAQPSGGRRLMVDGAPVAAPDFTDGGDINFSAFGSTVTGSIQVAGTTCLEATGDQIYHDTDCDGAKDGNEEFIDLPGLDDSQCGNGQIYKKTAGAWMCGADADSGSGLNIDRVLWVTTGGSDVPGTLNADCVGADDPNDCCTGAGTGTCEDCSTEECCTLSNPCATIQQAINEATELTPPSMWENPVTINVAAGNYDEKNIQLHNTDAGSSKYMIPAHGVSINGDGQLTTNIFSSSPVTGDCILNLRGSSLAKLRNISITASSGNPSFSGICSDGGAQGVEMYDVDITQNSNKGSPIDYRGPGNITLEANRLRSFDYLATEGRHLNFMSGNATSESFCNTAGIAYGACASNSDCGGLCGTLATNAGDFCAVDADCDGDVCDTGVCQSAATDYLFRNSLIQSNRQGVVFETMRTCNGGASANLTGTVEVASGATCSASVCSGITGSLACDTNADCARYVVGTTTDFDGADNVVGTTDDVVPVGERIIIDPAGSPQTKTVRKVHSATLLEVSDEIATLDNTGYNFRRTDDGWPCDTNSDCASGGSTGTCTVGSIGTLQKRFTYTLFINGDSGGECRDADGQPDIPDTPCDTNADCSGGDTCKSAAVVVDGQYDVSIDHSIFSPISISNISDHDIIARDSANVLTQHSTYDISRTLQADSGTVAPDDTGNFDAMYLTARDLTSPACSSVYEGLVAYDPVSATMCTCTDNAVPTTFTWCPVANPNCTNGSSTVCGGLQGFGTGDYEASDGGNYISVKDDDNAAGTAFAGIAGTWSIGDIDESATDKWCMFDSTTKNICLPAPSSTATQALFATATSGEPAFRAVAAADLPAHADAASDTTTWPLLGLAQTGTQTPATDAGLTYNSLTDTLSAVMAAGTGSTAVSTSNDDNDTSMATTAFVQQEIQDAADDGAHLTGAATGVINADAELYTDQGCVLIMAPTSDAEFYTVWRAATAITITEIYCEVTSGTSVAFDFEIDDGSATGVNGSNITCDTTGVTDSSLAGDVTMAAGDKLDVDFGTVTGSVTQASFCIKYTKDE